jgi:alginate O-acetyltransferase complex protein AlgI
VGLAFPISNNFKYYCRLYGRLRIIQNRTEQNRTEQNRTEQNRTEQNRTEQNRTEQNRTEQNRTIILVFSIFVNLTILGFFKYFNFFIDNFVSAFSLFGINFDAPHLKIILPVGISFYTFQTMSYTIDVYYNKLKPTKDFIAFAAFVSFFPQLVAGPIERAKQLLPQFYEKRHFNYNEAIDGCLQMIWGFFKKIVIADNCAIYVNMIFNNYQDYSGSTLFLGAIFFSFQIYGDFSGYSDIALGISRLFGITLSKNFSYPYFSRNMAEFWRRRHISLSTWFKDYIYIPLGGSRRGTFYSIRNIFVIFILSGFWHGANWTFVIWGFLNAACFLPLLLLKRNKVYTGIVAENKMFPSINEILNIFCTFIITIFLWIVFRSDNINHAARYIAKIFSLSLFSVPIFKDRIKALMTLLLITIFSIVEWIGRRENFAIQDIKRIKSHGIKYSVVLIIILAILFFGNFGENSFIYFQF